MSNEEDQDLVDYDEEEEEQNVAAEETADAEGKETKKWVNNCKKNQMPMPRHKSQHISIIRLSPMNGIIRHLLRQEGLV